VSNLSLNVVLNCLILLGFLFFFFCFFLREAIVHFDAQGVDSLLIYRDRFAGC
jgi:hypothetical protein